MNRPNNNNSRQDEFKYYYYCGNKNTCAIKTSVDLMQYAVNIVAISEMGRTVEPYNINTYRALNYLINGLQEFKYSYAKFLTYDICECPIPDEFKHVLDLCKSIGFKGTVVDPANYITEPVFDDRTIDIHKYYHTVILTNITPDDEKFIESIWAHNLILLTTTDVKITNHNCQRLFISMKLFSDTTVRCAGTITVHCQDTSNYRDFYDPHQFYDYMQLNVYLNEDNYFTSSTNYTLYHMPKLICFPDTYECNSNGSLTKVVIPKHIIPNRYIHPRYTTRHKTEINTIIDNTPRVVTDSSTAEFYKSEKYMRVYIKSMMNTHFTKLQLWLKTHNWEYLLFFTKIEYFAKIIKNHDRI